MNTRLKYVTIAVATVTAVLAFVAKLPVKGIWTISDFAPTLWGFWLGWLLATCRPVGLKKKTGVTALIFALLAVGDLYGVIRLVWLIQDTYWLRPVWRFLIFGTLGWAMGGNSIDREPEDSGIVQKGLTFIAFSVMYAWTELTAQYVGFCSHIPDAEALVRLYPVMSFISYLPLVGAVWYGIRCAQSNVVYKMMSVKWVRITCIVLTVVFGLHDIIWWSVSLGKIMIILNPLFAYAVTVLFNVFRRFTIRFDWDWKKIFMIG